MQSNLGLSWLIRSLPKGITCHERGLVFIFLLILISSGPVYAGWEALEKQHQPTGLETLYFDPETIHQEGTRATLWQLTDLKWNSATRFLSFKTHKEFDCERSHLRVLQIIEYSRHWQPVEERSANHALWKAACGKR